MPLVVRRHPTEVPASNRNLLLSVVAVGRWYQMYTDSFNAKTFEKGGVCLTADYAKSSTGLSVHNSENVGSVDGPVKVWPVALVWLLYAAPSNLVSVITGHRTFRVVLRPVKVVYPSPLLMHGSCMRHHVI
jgi:hypothetical protein